MCRARNQCEASLSFIPKQQQNQTGPFLVGRRNESQTTPHSGLQEETRNVFGTCLIGAPMVALHGFGVCVNMYQLFHKPGRVEWGEGVGLVDVVEKMRARALSQKTEKNRGINWVKCQSEGRRLHPIFISVITVVCLRSLHCYLATDFRL